MFETVCVTPGVTPSSNCASAVFAMVGPAGLAAILTWNCAVTVWEEATFGNPKAISSTFAGGGATVTYVSAGDPTVWYRTVPPPAVTIETNSVSFGRASCSRTKLAAAASTVRGTPLAGPKPRLVPESVNVTVSPGLGPRFDADLVIEIRAAPLIVTVSVTLAVALGAVPFAVSWTRPVWPVVGVPGTSASSMSWLTCPGLRLTMPPLARTGSPGSAVPSALVSTTIWKFARSKSSPPRFVTSRVTVDATLPVFVRVWTKDATVPGTTVAFPFATRVSASRPSTVVSTVFDVATTGAPDGGST